METVGLFGDLGDESVCRRLSASSVTCAGRKCKHCFHCEIASQLSNSACCLCLITYCKNLALDSRRTETIVPGAIINVKRKYFHWWPIFSFSGMQVRQILHTKMVNVQYSSCFELCGGSAKQQDIKFETLQVKCWAPCILCMKCCAVFLDPA